MPEILKMLRGRVVEVLCGLAMVVGGVWVTATSSTATPPATPNPVGIGLGGLLTALGGVLLSWVAALAFSRREALKQLNDQFNAVGRNLGQAATRVTRAVEQCQAQELDSATGLALIAQANTMIYGQIDQIQRLTSTQFDSDAFSITITELDKLASKLDRHPSASSVEIQDDVRQILARARSGAPRVLTEVKCPYCSVSSRVALGPDSGDTARVVCPSCNRQFNAHRSSSGSAFARPLRAMQPQIPAASLSPNGSHSGQNDLPPADPVAKYFACAACGASIEIRQAGDDNQRLMICTTCATSNYVTPISLQVVKGEKYERSRPEVIARSGSQPWVTCPSCRQSIRCALNNGRSRFGFCAKDRQLMEVTHEDFELWRKNELKDGAQSSPDRIESG